MAEPRRHKRGGIYFEDFQVGSLIEHGLTRTVTQMDNMLFSNMTLNPQPLHIDRHFCERETEWGQPLMNSLFTLGLMIGISVNDTTVGTTIANLGMTEVRFPHPLFEGDTVPLDGKLAKFYGANLPADAPMQDVQLAGQGRSGLLTHPFVMAVHAYGAETSPIHRGVFVARSLLGVALKPPPEAVAPIAPEERMVFRRRSMHIKRFSSATPRAPAQWRRSSE